MEHWIWLTSRRGLGPKGQRRLLAQFGSPKAVFEASPRDLERAGLSQKQTEPLLDRDLGPARAILDRCRQENIQILTLQSPRWPRRLAALEEVPILLYCRGQLPEEDAPIIGLVGARDADAGGLELARQLGYQIAKCGGRVVTGMARGVDAQSAWGALAAGGQVIGVLGCGPDRVYPRENRDLFARVAETGCLISQYPPGTPPNARHFPVRNRLISALADGVTVLRAAETSGSLITAQWAREQGRDLFAVPGDPDQSLSRGCNLLLRQGAIPALCGWDVLCQYEYRYPTAVREFHGRLEAPTQAFPLGGRGHPASPASRRTDEAGQCKEERDCRHQSADWSRNDRSGERDCRHRSADWSRNDRPGERDCRHQSADWSRNDRPGGRDCRHQSADWSRNDRPGGRDCRHRSADRSGNDGSGRADALPEPTDPTQRAILEALAEGPLQADALIARLDLPTGKVLTQLTLLQVKGYISQAPGKIYTLG